MTRFLHVGRLVLATGLSLALAGAPADARVGGGASSGSRGGKTFSAPPSTATAPGAVQPMQRTEAPSMAPRPGVNAPAAQPSRFGFGSGLMAGLVGAGLLGMVFGHGFMGGLSGLSSIFGLLFQVALIGGLIWLALRFFRRRSEPAFAGAGAPYGRSALAGGLPASGGGAAAPGGAVAIGPADYAGFERALVDIQSAYGREDMDALSRLATPEMLRYFGTDLEENRRRGLRNEVSGAVLRQGDLAEAWREGGREFATVAMRFGLVDAMVERATGRVVEGDRARVVEVRELWTFCRDGGGPWLLSAIQQTA